MLKKTHPVIFQSHLLVKSVVAVAVVVFMDVVGVAVE